jgi:3-hydroxybutyryl-CoA dehydratase
MAEAALRLPTELTLGTRARVDFSVDDAQMRRFAELSGDHNPLHTDEQFARAKGFEGRVVYGALLLAKVSQLIGMKLPGRDGVWVSVALDFRSPLYLDQVAEVEATVESYSEATGLLELRLALRRSGRLLAKGRAEVVVGS